MAPACKANSRPFVSSVPKAVVAGSNTFGNISDDNVKIPDIQVENKKKGCC